ncbi:glutathione S-transferase C-terminal domain-containing protein [Secundilactobacillus collinoides]|uniref:Glutathione transferase n=1 Tax=Secundilactobacillus collinoides DSM 20515 = JCM 1123 TaxID=1423733 RepID=A0A0R2BBU4_SECCO|nr:glutathione S-transferase C-terminal domain-containing protein [Secundilactobacillus collinoides]KRM73324.1 glutathione transferase [Secundilactobacillus collinoides DSM 20515 = JCM 1123]
MSKQQSSVTITTPFGNRLGQLPVISNQYCLVYSKSCPWATRATIAIDLLGLGNVIDTIDIDHGGLDTKAGSAMLLKAYRKTIPDFDGRPGLPAVIDKATGKVVQNDHEKLTNYLEVQWVSYQKRDAPDLYPEAIRDEIDLLNDILFHDVNNGVYKAGRATSQKAYEQAYDHLFYRLDWLNERLGHHRFLFGNQLTDSDIRLYTTLARFDTAYYTKFNCNKKRLCDYDNLWAYARDLYSMPAFKKNTDFEAIKVHYYMAGLEPEDFQIIPKGPDQSGWTVPNDRKQFEQDASIALIDDNELRKLTIEFAKTDHTDDTAHCSLANGAHRSLPADSVAE